MTTMTTFVGPPANAVLISRPGYPWILPLLSISNQEVAVVAAVLLVVVDLSLLGIMARRDNQVAPLHHPPTRRRLRRLGLFRDRPRTDGTMMTHNIPGTLIVSLVQTPPPMVTALVLTTRKTRNQRPTGRSSETARPGQHSSTSSSSSSPSRSSSLSGPWRPSSSRPSV